MTRDITFPIQTGTETWTTAGGIETNLINLSVGGDRALVVIPPQVKERTHVTFVSYNHGYTENERNVLNASFGGALHEMVERGWVVASGNNGGFSWGNETSMRAIRSLHAWANSIYHVDQSIIMGGSMGGLTTLNAYGRDELPDAVAAVAYVSVVDNQAMGEGYHASIRSAWGVSSMSDLTEAQAGYDPARDDPQKWADKPIWLNNNTNDTLVPKAQHGDAFMGRAATPDSIVYHVGSTAHTFPLRHGQTVPFMDWLDGFAPAYDDTQEPTQEEGGGGGWWSGLMLTDGTPVVLSATDGTLVSLAPPA